MERRKTTEALLATSTDSWAGITHVLIYSTSSITLLLLLTPGDFFNCFFQSQYCHFIIPRLPLLLMKKGKGEAEHPECGQNCSGTGGTRSRLRCLSQRRCGGSGLDWPRRRAPAGPASGPHVSGGLPSPSSRAAPGLGVDRESTSGSPPAPPPLAWGAWWREHPSAGQGGALGRGVCRVSASGTPVALNFLRSHL